MKEKYYDLKYKICSDYDFFYKIYKEGKKFNYASMIISVYEMGRGLSKNKYEWYRECIQIARRKNIVRLIIYRWYNLYCLTMKNICLTLMKIT
jgi:hypothetical protein